MIELPRGEFDIDALAMFVGPDALYAPIDFRPCIARIAVGKIPKSLCSRYPAQMLSPHPSAMIPTRS